MVSQPSVPFLASFRRSWRRRVNAHFKFELDGRPIAYCYIRKNASSAFKRMMLDMHGYDGPWSGAFAFMKQNCGVGSVEDVRSASWRVYVYRDPFERAASLFRNKLVMQKDADDLLANFVRVMHSDPEDATFTEFVRWYLPAKYADPHVWAQSDHLLPVDYNCAWSMAWLQDHGGEIADRYFLKPANQSSEHLFNDPSEDVPVRELRQHYDRTGELPGVRALRNNETSRMIHDLYERDYELESSVQKSEPALA